VGEIVVGEIVVGEIVVDEIVVGPGCMRPVRAVVITAGCVVRFA